MRFVSRSTAYVTIASFLVATTVDAADPPRLEFTRMVAHWAKYDDPEYLPFIEQARPDLVQLGFYGGHFWSLAHTPQYKGYPSHFPVQGLAECGQWFQEKNAALDKLDVKVVGHFNVEFLVGEPDGPDGPRGFFHFYRNLWDEKVLGPKPVEDPLDMMEHGPDGKPIINNSYKIGGMHEYWACLRNPNWQRVLKAWVKHGIDRGLDGFIANYFYRHNCLCEHCQSGFRTHLRDNFTPEKLNTELGIADVAKHKFDELVYWHNPDESSPLKREMLRWSQISNKQVFDEVFHRYGRSLKPDLITAQWNHLGRFSQIRGDERCMLPADIWGKDETYTWYSLGGSAHYSDLEKRYLGEGTLQARFIRGAFDDKPFTLGKYENTRIRIAISELAANGGAPMGFYTRYTDPAARKEIARYYQFLGKHDSLYRASASHAEAVLLFPRSHVHGGNVEPVQQFLKLGDRMLDEHVLFDVLPDDLATPERLQRYRHVVSIEKPAIEALLSNPQRSRFELPYTVRVSANQSADGKALTLHFVNYDRKEPPKGRDGKPSAGGGIKDEQNIAISGGSVDFLIPKSLSGKTVEFLTPESADATKLEFSVTENRLRLKLPEFLAYGVVVIR